MKVVMIPARGGSKRIPRKNLRELCGRPFFSSASRMYQMPCWRVQDIDTPEDWRRAELMMSVLSRSGSLEA